MSVSASAEQTRAEKIGANVSAGKRELARAALLLTNERKVSAHERVSAFSPLASPAGHGATVDRSSKIGPLPNLGGILTSDANGGHSTPPPPSLILAKSYPIFLLHPLLQLLRHHAVDHGPAPLEQFTRHPCQLNYLASLTAPVMAVPSGTVAGLGSNWFLKAELYYILDVLSVSVEHWRRRRHDEDPDEVGGTAAGASISSGAPFE
ncbi:conserved hypothetical protein [Culex quinquefasciatus]|uniref:Uncharacterized protein n=1 Tax=Culex quinquefasciatus TaxID=7176 RepID=B0W1L2_CULQU|nr:conserved hypothetical protein [Culex quinquefasciatus]|eukprot:XP_001842596.1 conserved hypothetical protein [Culex quinquefasciatus]